MNVNPALISLLYGFMMFPPSWVPSGTFQIMNVKNEPEGLLQEVSEEVVWCGEGFSVPGNCTLKWQVWKMD